MGHQQHRGRPVVVGVDGSEKALRAVRWAAAEAACRRTPLRIVVAFERSRDHPAGVDRLGRTCPDIAVDEARRLLAEAAAVARRAAHGLDVDQQLVVGSPVPMLIAESRRAHLVVIGDRGLGGMTGLLLGSVGTALAVHAASPVAVVRGELSDPAAPIVVGVGGSPVSDTALAFAYDAAAARRAPLVAVHAWWDGFVDPDVAPLRHWNVVEADEQQMLAERLVGWSEKYPDVQVQCVILRDRPEHGLVEQSRCAQLVVVGRGPLLGSAGHALLHCAACPVAVVRPETGG
jgi:nucleotide-binding universal stress UspA family protein